MMKPKIALAIGICALTALSLSGCSDASEAPDETATATPVGPEATPAADPGEQMAYDGPIPMPIRVGGDGPQMDACGTAAEVAGLETYLSVRDAPSDEVKERDRLDAGQMVSVCATSGEWTGVVYAKEGDEARDCGTGSPVATEQNYVGPCRQGWVRSRYLKVVAG